MKFEKSRIIFFISVFFLKVDLGSKASDYQKKLSGTRREAEKTKKTGGRAGLRKFARAMRSMFGSVRAARALQDVSMCLSTRALARKSSW